MRIMTKVTYRGIEFCALCFILFLLVAFNTNNLDYWAYCSNYNNLNWVKGTEYVYFALEILFNRLGFSFAQFKVVMALISFFLLYVFVEKNASRSPSFFLLYLVYPFFLDSIEIRHFLGLGIWLYGVSFLIEGVGFKRVKYCVATLLASGIQSMYLIFLPFTFCLNFKIRGHKYFKYVLLFFALISIALMLMPSLFLSMVNKGFSLMSGFFPNDVRKAYFDAVYTNHGYLVFFVESMLSFFIFWLVFKDVGCMSLSIKESRLFEFSYLLAFFLILLLPLYRINGQFTRITQSAVVFFHVSIVAYLQASKCKCSRFRQLVIVLYVMYVLSMSFTRILYKHWNDIVVNLFKNNLLFV